MWSEVEQMRNELRNVQDMLASYLQREQAPLGRLLRSRGRLFSAPRRRKLVASSSHRSARLRGICFDSGLAPWRTGTRGGAGAAVFLVSGAGLNDLHRMVLEWRMDVQVSCADVREMMRVPRAP